MNAQMTRVDTAHRDVVHDAQLNYYGNRLATCSTDRLIKVFEIKPSGQAFPLAELVGHKGPVWQVSWAHPRFDTILASASYDRRVIVWKETDSRYEQIYEYTGHDASVNGVAFAPPAHGLVLATAGADCQVTIITYDPTSNTWNPRQILKAHDQGVNAVSWAPTGQTSVSTSASGLNVASRPTKRIATGGNDKQVKIWKEDETGDWKLEKTLAGHNDFVRDVAWSPVLLNTTTTIASCGNDRQVLIWRCSNIEEGNWQPRLLSRFDGALWHLSWSLCGSMLAVSGEDNKITLWKENLQGQWTRLPDDEELRRQEASEKRAKERQAAKAATVGHHIPSHDRSFADPHARSRATNALVANALDS